MSNIDKQDSQVQRYANFGVDMMEWADGGYVKYSDYVALLDELEPMALAHLNLNLLCDVYRTAYEEARHDGLVNWEAAASLAEENGDLKRKLEAAEKRIAELQAWERPGEVSDEELNAALQLHRLKVDGHSQLSDAFRAGFKYARRAAAAAKGE
ncbi:hypothetical protein [Enterobacter cloacae]|uniref:hypothetical protein n=1 Tax=Enterobacter cloacae TaxID=550 RepID=UPI001123CEED|nr:hypothetical protein [Enterobacter cloacae]TOZ47201.1 hypothetical protein DK925_09545 [Enterobacter cloacae]